MTIKNRLISNIPLRLLGLLFVTLNSMPVQAEVELTGMYGGMYFSESEDEFEPDTGSKVKQSRGHIKGKFGKTLNEFLAVEGQLGVTTSSDDNKGIYTLSAFLRADKDFGQYKIYGLLGYSGIYAYEDDFEDVDESSASYGIGLDIFGSKDMAITIEYVNLIDTSVDGADANFGEGNLSFDTIGIGFTYYFSDETSRFIKNRDKIRSIRQ